MIKTIKEAFLSLKRKYKRNNSTTFMSGIVVLLFLSFLIFFDVLVPYKLFFSLFIFWLLIVYKIFNGYFFLSFFTLAFMLVLLGMNERAEEIGNIIFFILLFVCIKECIGFFRTGDKND